MRCRRLHFLLDAALIAATILCCACGADNQRTLQRLGSSKADSARDGVAAILPAGDTAQAAAERGVTSDVRVRVRDQDALSQEAMSRQSGDVNARDDGGGPPPWSHGHGRGRGRGHHKGD